MRPSETLHEHRDAILKLAAEWKVASVNVFGSIAHGTDSAESDVDLLVKMAPGASLFDLSGFGVDIETLLGIPVDIVSDGRQTTDAVMDRIRAEAVPL